MSVLDAFVHDPLVEWEDEKKRMVRLSFLPISCGQLMLSQEKSRKTLAQRKKAYTNALKDEVDLRQLAKGALMPIQKKLQGIYTPWDSRDDGKEMSTSNLVDALIQDAKSLKNLVGTRCPCYQAKLANSMAGSNVSWMGTIPVKFKRIY